MSGPLDGVRVVDTTSVLMGPYATQVLGDMGADVIKVEAPEGDITRLIGPSRNDGMGAIFINANRSKRSIAIDLKHPAGKSALMRLVAGADVFTYNVRPKSMERLGLTWESVSAVNPRIVYCGVFGFGEGGPYAGRPAYDDLIQGASTLSTLLARSGDGTPRYVPTAIADRITGMTAVNAILAALVHAGKTGRGQRIDVPMFETLTRFVLNDHLGGRTFDPPLDRGGYARQLSPDRRPYQTSDGYVCALIYNDKQWRNFFRAMGLAETLGADPRFLSVPSRTTHVDSIYAEISRIFETRTTAEWIALLDEADIPVMPLHDLELIFDDPQLRATGFFRTETHPSEGELVAMREPTEWSETQPGATRPAPRLGEHGPEILREAGFDDTEIQGLIAAGAIGSGQG